MSRVMRGKNVLKATMADDYKLPKHNQRIVRVVRSQGNNLFGVETANMDDEHFLVTMPMKFRNFIWIAGGDYILVEPIRLKRRCNKVKEQICEILIAEHIEKYIKANIWRECFAKKNNDVQNNYLDSDTDFDDLQPNMNIPSVMSMMMTAST